MSEIHNFVTEFIPVDSLDDTFTLVGESGGLSAVYSRPFDSVAMPGNVSVLTEHGYLYFLKGANVEVYVS